MRIPFIDKQVVEYLKEIYSLENIVPQLTRLSNDGNKVGFVLGVQEVLGRLTAIVKEQEGD